MKKENFWLRIIYLLSGVLSLTVAFLILGPRPEGIEGAQTFPRYLWLMHY